MKIWRKIKHSFQSGQNVGHFTWRPGTLFKVTGRLMLNTWSKRGANNSVRVKVHWTLRSPPLRILLDEGLSTFHFCRHKCGLFEWNCVRLFGQPKRSKYYTNAPQYNTYVAYFFVISLRSSLHIPKYYVELWHHASCNTFSSSSFSNHLTARSLSCRQLHLAFYKYIYIYIYRPYIQ
jgi:hypothetical protein